MKKDKVLEKWIKGFILFSIFITPFIQLPIAYNYVLIKLSQLQFFLLLSFLFFIIEMVKRGKIKIILHPGYRFFIFLFIWYILSTLFSSYPHASRPYLYRQISYLLLFYFVSILNWEEKEKKIIIGILLLPFFSLVVKESISYLQSFSNGIRLKYSKIGIREILQYFHIHEIVIPSTFGNPNFFAAYIDILFPLSLLFSLHNLKGKKSLIGIPSLIITFFSLLLIYETGSRAGILGIIIGIITILILYYREILKGKKKLIFYISLTLIILIVFIPLTHKYPSFKEKFNKDLERGTIGIRVRIWQGTLKMIKARPLVGWGLGTYYVVYPNFRVPAYFLNPHAVNATDHAHDELLEIWSETGIIGLIVFLGFIIISLREGIRKFYKTKSFVFPSLIGGIISIIANNLFGVNLRYSSSSIFFFAFLGLIFSIHSKPTKTYHFNFSFSDSKKFFYLIIISLLSGWVFFNVGMRENFCQIHLKRGIVLRHKLIWNKAIDEYLRSLVWDPYNLRARYRLAFAYASTNNLKKAIKEYLEIKKYAPHYAETDFNLGAIYLRKGDFMKAHFYLDQMLKLNPYHAPSHANLALIYKKMGEKERAIEEFRKSISLNPSLLPAYWDLAKLLEEKGEFQEAIKVLTELSKRDTKNAKIKRIINLLRRKSEKK